jgi:hypothetical protein
VRDGRKGSGILFRMRHRGNWIVLFCFWNGRTMDEDQ